MADGDNIWPNRARFNAETIRRYDPDLIGFQEVQEGNLASYDELLPGYDREIGPRYNNHDPFAYPSVFWKPGKLEKLESGGFWLSKTPDEYSGDWDTNCIRSACWVRFHEKETGRELVLLNTHLDHLGEVARVEGSKVIVQRLEAVRRTAPVIATGDFNANPGSEAYTVWAENGFSDAFLEAGNAEGGETYSFHAFTGKKQRDIGRIDWILTKNGDGQLISRSCRIITDSRPPLYPSDHCPVQAEIEIGS